MEMMHHRAMYQVNECLAVCLRSPRSEDKWTCVKRDHHLELYAKKSNRSQSVCYLGMNQIHCGFDEVFDLLNFQNTQQFRLMMKLLYARNFRDGALMATHAPREFDDDYEVADVQHAAVWFTLQDGRESVLGKDNMLAFFQALMVLHPERSSSAGHATSTTAPQQPQFARPSESIHKRTLALAWLPLTPMDNETPELRTTVRLQYTLIVEEVSRNCLRLSCVATSFQDGDDPYAQRSSTSRQIAKRLVKRSVSCLESAVIAARISAQPLASRHQWVKNQDRAACVVCWKPFHAILRRRHHCRACGEVICGSCSSLRSTATLLRHSQKLEKVRVCHMCSNRGGMSARARRQQRSNSFSSSQPQVGASTMDSILATSRSRPQRVVHLEADDLIESQDAFTEDEDVGNGSGYFGAYLGAALTSSTTSSQKLISLRSMSRADLIARSASTTSSWKQSDSSTASSVATQRRRRNPPPPPFVGRVNATPRRTPPPPPPSQPPPSSARQPTPYYGASMLPLSGLQKQAELLSLSFLHPAALNPERTHVPPKSIIAEVGSHERPPAAAASHERASLEMLTAAMAISETDEHRMSDVPRRTSILSLAMLESCSSAENSGGLPRLDPVRENNRLKLMRVICSPACTLVDRALMRECCELAAATFGVRGAFIARVEEMYVVLEHVAGTTKLSAIDHFLRTDTPCDYVLVTPPGEQLVRIADCSNDKRTSGMVMVRDVNMKFFVGVSICVRGLPIACLCAFSEDGSEHATMFSNQYEFQVLEKVAHRIEMELEQLVHGLNIA